MTLTAWLVRHDVAQGQGDPLPALASGLFRRLVLVLGGLVLLDRNGNQLTPNESAENSSTDRQELFFIFYSPVMVDQVSQVKIGTLSGTVS